MAHSSQARTDGNSLDERITEQDMQRFADWMEVKGAQLGSCRLGRCKDAGIGLFCADNVAEGPLMATSLCMAITTMTIFKDPVLGTSYRKLFESGEWDDRLLIMLFLIVERARASESSWAPYLNILPVKFSTPLWFKEEELMELKGTALFEATKMQAQHLDAIFNTKVKDCAEALLLFIDNSARKLEFEDFLWAYSIFWTRALNIPCPRSFILLEGTSCGETLGHTKADEKLERDKCMDLEGEVPSQQDTCWIEGLIPGIDFCNHCIKANVSWEIDQDEGAITGIPFSMYLVPGKLSTLEKDTEITINYGNKGNEELLFLYGFVLEDNPDDYIMVHFPKENLKGDPCFEAKIQLLEEQNLPLRWLLPAALLQKGHFHNLDRLPNQRSANPQSTGFSWSGTRTSPAYLNFLVFPEDMLAALRVIAMGEDELSSIFSLLEQLSWQPTEQDIKSAVWEICGDERGFQLLANLLVIKLNEFEEATGPESLDVELLEDYARYKLQNQDSYCERSKVNAYGGMSKNSRNSIIYRSGQKRYFKLFLEEANYLCKVIAAENS